MSQEGLRGGWGREGREGGGCGDMGSWVWLQSWEGFSEEAASALEKRLLSGAHSDRQARSSGRRETTESQKFNH